MMIIPNLYDVRVSLSNPGAFMKPTFDKLKLTILLN